LLSPSSIERPLRGGYGGEVSYRFPEKMAFLFRPARFKVGYGGRDGSKSWSFARALLLEGAAAPLQIGCFREVQKSLKDSVHQLITNQIQDLGLGHFYTPFKDEIRGNNGTTFYFAGLSAQTRESIKSFEGLDRAWVEEAHNVGKRSWDILEPTIRKPDSEIWVSFNPEMDTDETYQRFVVKPSPEVVAVHINWNDNPWRSKVLDAARERMQRESPDDYAHIYGGMCRPAIAGALYYKEVSALRQAGRLANVPYDPMLRVHVICDLGFNDLMSLLLVQRLASEIRVIRYIEDRFRDIPSYSQELKSLNLNWGTVYLPHDGKAKTLASSNNPHGATPQGQFENLGWRVEIVPNVDVEQGIRKVREVFPRVYIDKSSASEPSKTTGTDLVNRLGRYRRRVNADGQASTPVHDDESHGADGYRYLALVADQLSNDLATKPVDLSALTRGWAA
jgi:phage terminase large subunit